MKIIKVVVFLVKVVKIRKSMFQKITQAEDKIETLKLLKLYAQQYKNRTTLKGVKK